LKHRLSSYVISDPERSPLAYKLRLIIAYDISCSGQRELRISDWLTLSWS